MTARADAAPVRVSAPRLPRAGVTAVISRLVRRLAAALRRALRARPPNACHLSDRQLADIGLTRADLPDHRGWRR